MTAVIAASASGKCAPLFVIAAGKNVMDSSTKPLQEQDFTNMDKGPHWLTNEDWLPGDCVIPCTENGSVDKNTMPFVVEHINRYIRQFVRRHQPIVLLLDGHSSRKGTDWVQYGEGHNIVLVLLPAITKHFLQPCDNSINKTFQRTVRATRDALLKMAQTNVHAVSFKLKLAVAAHAAISEDVVRNAFIETEIWPVDYRFLKLFQRQNSQKKK